MNNMWTRKSTKPQIFTYLSLFFLLVVRFPISDFVSSLSHLFNLVLPSPFIESLRLLQEWTFFLWEKFAFILVGIVVLINHSNPTKFHIDKFFLVLFSIGGLLFCGYYFRPVGWMGVLISGYILYLLFRNKYKFNTDPRPKSILPIIILVIVFSIFWLIKIDIFGRPSLQSFDNYIYHLSKNLPFWLIEEVIFRGILWSIMIDLGWADLAIIIFQTVLFWIFHIYYIFSEPILFWLALPILSTLLVALTWKYKSITPSSIAHILFNLR